MEPTITQTDLHVKGTCRSAGKFAGEWRRVLPRLSNLPMTPRRLP